MLLGRLPTIGPPVSFAPRRDPTRCPGAAPTVQFRPHPRNEAEYLANRTGCQEEIKEATSPITLTAAEVKAIYADRTSSFTVATPALAATTATLKGAVNDNSATPTVSFEYGKTTRYGQRVTGTPSPPQGTTVTLCGAKSTSTVVPGGTLCPVHQRRKPQIVNHFTQYWGTNCRILGSLQSNWQFLSFNIQV